MESSSPSWRLSWRKHLQLNSGRLFPHSSARQEVRLYLETPRGTRFKDASISHATNCAQPHRDENAMDDDSVVPFGKRNGKPTGKGRGRAQPKAAPTRTCEQCCRACGKWVAALQQGPVE